MKRQDKEARILARLYRDCMDVYRVAYEKNPATGVKEQRELRLYQDVPCGLSMSNKDAPQRADCSYETSNRHIIFAPVEIGLKENDRAVIRTETGQIYEGRTGKTFVLYSHGETDFLIEKVT